MAWLRLDDGFAEHPKIVALSDADFRRWVETLLYCARRREDGVLTIAALERLLGWGARDEDEDERDGIAWLLELGLLNEHGTDATGERVSSYRVHDWHVYNGAKSDAERKREQRARDYGADYYGKPVGSHGGRRGEYGSAASSHEAVTTGERDESVSIARAVSPSPSPKNKPSELQDEGLEAGGKSDDLDFEFELRLARFLESCGRLEPAQADELRGLARRVPEAVLARVRETFAAGGVRDRYAYALRTLRNELES